MAGNLSGTSTGGIGTKPVLPVSFFEHYQNLGKEMGFASIISAPLVRSSFHAAGSEKMDTLNVKTIG